MEEEKETGIRKKDSTRGRKGKEKILEKRGT
jgi:hypothetical protein